MQQQWCGYCRERRERESAREARNARSWVCLERDKSPGICTRVE